jgi:hypothetical protein
MAYTVRSICSSRGRCATRSARIRYSVARLDDQGTTSHALLTSSEIVFNVDCSVTHGLRCCLHLLL